MSLTSVEKLKKIIFYKLNYDLYDKSIRPYAGEFWIIDLNDNRWFLKFTNNGQLRYNQIFFDSFFKLFSLEYKSYQNFIKEWFELNFELSVNDIQKINTSYDFYVLNLLSNEKPWSIQNRHGFGYYFVRRFLDLQKLLPKSNVVLEHYLKDHSLTPKPNSK